MNRTFWPLIIVAAVLAIFGVSVYGVAHAGPGSGGSSLRQTSVLGLADMAMGTPEPTEVAEPTEMPEHGDALGANAGSGPSLSEQDEDDDGQEMETEDDSNDDSQGSNSSQFGMSGTSKDGHSDDDSGSGGSQDGGDGD
jgi:hypothetical protein